MCIILPSEVLGQAASVLVTSLSIVYNGIHDWRQKWFNGLLPDGSTHLSLLIGSACCWRSSPLFFVSFLSLFVSPSPCNHIRDQDKHALTMSHGWWITSRYIMMNVWVHYDEVPPDSGFPPLWWLTFPLLPYLGFVILFWSLPLVVSRNARQCPHSVGSRFHPTRAKHKGL